MLLLGILKFTHSCLMVLARSATFFHFLRFLKRFIGLPDQARCIRTYTSVQSESRWEHDENSNHFWKKQPVQNITKQHTTSHSCFLSYQARIHFFPYADILDTGTEACAHLSIFAAASALVTCQTHGLVHSLPLFFSFSRGNGLLQHFNKTDTGGLHMAVACFKMIDPIDA